MAKDNIIKFPTPHERKMKDAAEKLQESEDAVFAASTECAEMSQEFLSNLEHLLQDGIISDWQIFKQMEFRNEEYPESRDVYVLINMFNAMLNRHVGIPHELHREFDRLFIKIKKTAEQHAEIRDRMEELDVFFDPDFEFDGDDDDRD
tara:strand:+ start:3679 stop:4122 length:444 start_codon:yes stop_codon:yes gene_type:complete